MNTSSKAGQLFTNSLIFSLSEKVFISLEDFLSLLKDFTGCTSLIWWDFPFTNYFTPLSSWLQGWGEVVYNFYLCPPISIDTSVFLIFRSLSLMCQRALLVYLSCLALSELPGSAVWCLTSAYRDPVTAVTQLSPVFLSFRLLLLFSLRHAFCSSRCPSMFCSVFLQSLFCFLRLYGHTLKLKDSFLSCVQSTNKPIKGIHHFLKIILFIYLFLALLGLCCYEGFSLVVASRAKETVKLKWGHWGWPQSNTTGVLIRRGTLNRDRCRRKAMWRHTEKMAVYKSRRETSEESNPANNLILKF